MQSNTTTTSTVTRRITRSQLQATTNIRSAKHQSNTTDKEDAQEKTRKTRLEIEEM